MLTGETSLVEGARDLAQIASRLRASESLPHELKYFLGVASETEDFPLGQERAMWNEDALARKDVEAERYLLRTRLEALEQCKRILRWADVELRPT
jgi:hypothetical protein